jgi:uncharacterized protein
MQVITNQIIGYNGNYPVVADVFFLENRIRKPVVVYAHGFAGFKDWGNFNLVANQFAEAGFVFIKFNFSHNGTSLHAPEEFVDLEAFGNNNYTKELDDLQKVIDWIRSDFPYKIEANVDHISLVGHSMGGGISIIKASEEPVVKKLVTWASISECKTPWSSWSQEKLSEWKASGVLYYENSRTKQKMPLYYQLYEDFHNNSNRLDIQSAMQRLNVPVLICHGLKDEAVPVQKAYDLKSWNPGAIMYLVDSDHVFGRKHPWTENFLPQPMQDVLDKTINFLK